MRPILRGKKFLMNATAGRLPTLQTVTSAAPNAGAGLMLASLVLSWITLGRCHIQQLISRSEHLEK